MGDRGSPCLSHLLQLITFDLIPLTRIKDLEEAKSKEIQEIYLGP